jgi:uncharacterized membrane protein
MNRRIQIRRRFVSNADPGDAVDLHFQLGLERLIFFSDAVFAISITLLVLEIHLPAGETLYTDAELFRQLSGMWQSYLAYILSFLVIGTFWIAHHRKFRYIKQYNGGLIMLNLIFLMIVAFIPFPTSVLSSYSGLTATVFYALVMLLASLLMTAIWWYASWQARLIDPKMDAKQRRRQFIAPLITAGIFLISIGLAYLNQNLARLSWLLILVASLIVGRSDQIEISAHKE